MGIIAILFAIWIKPTDSKHKLNSSFVGRLTAMTAFGFYFGSKSIEALKHGKV